MNKALRIAVILSVVVLSVMLISPVSAQVIGPAVPVPADFTGATVNQTSIALTWTNDLSGKNVLIERTTNSFSNAKYNWSVVATINNGTTHTDNGLRCGATYAYRARTFDPALQNYSAYAKTIVVKTADCQITPNVGFSTQGK